MSRPGWRQPVKIGDAISATLQRLGLDNRMRQHEVWRVWSAVVGPQIARQAQPCSLTHGRLIIHVTDPIWLHHLSMMRHRLVSALNEQLKPAVIRELTLRIGEVTAMPESPTPLPAEPAPADEVDPDVVAKIDGAIGPLGDAPFRDALRRLWLRASRESGPLTPSNPRKKSENSR